MLTEARRKSNARRRKATREALLRAADELFRTRGYHRTTISAIVRRARLAQGSFYNHFSDKRQILGCLFDDVAARLVAGFSDAATHEPASFEEHREIVTAAVRRLLTVLEDNRPLVEFFFREAPVIDEEFARRLESMLDGFTAIAQSYVDRAIALGFARPCRSDVVAHAIVGIGLRLNAVWGSSRLTNIDLDAIVDEVANLIYDGVSVPEGGDGA